MQAIKIRELMNADTQERAKLIQKDYVALQNLSTATNPNRHSGTTTMSPSIKIKLDKLRAQQLHYGRVVPPGIGNSLHT